MVDIIGNSFDGIGIIPSSKIIKGGHRTIIGSGSGLFRQVLGFDKGTYANASERHLLARPSVTDPYEMTGPFAANILATRQRNGKTYGLFEEQYTNPLTYNRLLTNASWTKVRLETPTTHTDPLGGSEAWKLIPNSESEEVHRVYKSFTPDGSSNYLFYAIVEKGEYDWIELLIPGGGFATNVVCFFDTTNGVIGTTSNCVDKDILPLVDGRYLCYVIATSTSATSSSPIFYVAEGDNDVTFTGNSSDGIYIFNPQIVKAEHFVNAIKTVASPVTKPGDYFYFPSASVPTWMKSKFTVPLTLNYDYPSQISANKPIWSFQKTASTLSTGNGNHGMAVNDTYLYWVNQSAGKIHRSALDGSGRIDLITGLTSPMDCAITSSYIVWSDFTTGKIQRADLDGSNVTDLKTGLSGPFGVCADETYAYYTDYTAGLVEKVPLATGASSNILTGETSPMGIAIDSTHLYFITSTATGTARRVLIGGGTAENFISGNVSYYIAVDSDFVYTGSYNSNAIFVASKAKANKTILLEQTHAYAVAVLGGTVFYSTSDSSVIKRLDTVTAWLGTDGKIKVVDGPDTKVETGAATSSMHQDVEVEFDRVNGKVTLSGFTSGNGETVGSAWTSLDGFDVEYGCALKGTAQTDGLAGEPEV